jgi:hypothetical protein
MPPAKRRGHLRIIDGESSNPAAAKQRPAPPRLVRAADLHGVQTHWLPATFSRLSEPAASGTTGDTRRGRHETAARTLSVGCLLKCGCESAAVITMAAGCPPDSRSRRDKMTRLAAVSIEVVACSSGSHACCSVTTGHVTGMR